MGAYWRASRGDVTALKLNIDFSAAGLLGTSFPFGDLIRTGFGGTSLAGLENMTVSQFLALDSTTLGGGSTGYNITDLDPLRANLNGSFEGGTPSRAAWCYWHPGCWRWACFATGGVYIL